MDNTVTSNTRVQPLNIHEQRIQKWLTLDFSSCGKAIASVAKIVLFAVSFLVHIPLLIVKCEADKKQRNFAAANTSAAATSGPGAAATGLKLPTPDLTPVSTPKRKHDGGKPLGGDEGSSVDAPGTPRAPTPVSVDDSAAPVQVTHPSATRAAGVGVAQPFLVKEHAIAVAKPVSGSFPTAEGFDFTTMQAVMKDSIARYQGIYKTAELREALKSPLFTEAMYASEVLPGLVIGGKGVEKGILTPYRKDAHGRDRFPERLGALDSAVVANAKRLAKGKFSEDYGSQYRDVREMDPRIVAQLLPKQKKERDDFIRLAPQIETHLDHVPFKTVKGNGVFDVVFTANGQATRTHRYICADGAGNSASSVDGYLKCNSQVVERDGLDTALVEGKKEGHIDCELHFNGHDAMKTDEYKAHFKSSIKKAHTSWKVEKKSLLVHCSQGLERSNAVIICMLAYEFGMQGQKLNDDLKQFLINFMQSARNGASGFDDPMKKEADSSRHEMLKIVWAHTKELVAEDRAAASR